MKRREVERARSRLWARLYTLTLREEVVGDREDIGQALQLMRLHAAGEGIWEKRVTWLAEETAQLPLFTGVPNRKTNHCYEPVIERLVEWGYSSRQTIFHLQGKRSSQRADHLRRKVRRTALGRREGWKGHRSTPQQPV